MPKNSPIRLIALDLDDTLLDSDLRVPPSTQAVIREARQRGIIVTLATGRMFRSALPYAQELGITAPLITYNGALVREPEPGGVTLSHRPIPLEAAREVVALCQREGLSLNVYLEDTLYVAEINEAVAYYLSIAQVTPQVVGDLMLFLDRAAKGVGPTKLLICAAEEEIAFWLPHLQRRYGAKLHLTRSKARFIEILAPGVNKGVGLAFLTSHLGLTPAQVMAVGDGENDREMLRFAGLAVAVGNAPPHIQTEADYVTASPAAYGVAEAIERLVL